jgi:hypothetical protein
VITHEQSAHYPWRCTLNQTADGGTAVDGGMPIPSYQKVVVGTNDSGASLTYRNVPDIAMVASDIDNEFGGVYVPGRGTSYSSPLFASFLAIANQQAIANGNKPIGFANPALYSFAGTGYLYDITSGSTATGSCNLDGGLANPGCINQTYYALPGFDLTTGLGSPTCDLVGELASIQASPWVAETTTAFPCVKEVAGSENSTGGAFGPAAAWAISCTHNGDASPDYTIYRLSALGGTWTQQAGGAIHVSVSTAGVPWVVNSAGAAFQLETSVNSTIPCTSSPASCAWTQMNTGTGNDYNKLSYVAAGPTGTAWATSQTAYGTNGDFTVDYYNGTWHSQSGVGFKHVSVSNNIAVAHNNNGTQFTSNGSNGATWIVAAIPPKDGLYDAGTYTGAAHWVAASPSLTGHQDSISWAILDTPWVTGSNDYVIAELVQRSAGENVWMQVPGGARAVSVSPGSGRPWVSNYAGTAYCAWLGYSQ